MLLGQEEVRVTTFDRKDIPIQPNGDWLDVTAVSTDKLCEKVWIRGNIFTTELRAKDTSLPTSAKIAYDLRIPMVGNKLFCIYDKPVMFANAIPPQGQTSMRKYWKPQLGGGLVEDLL